MPLAYHNYHSVADLANLLLCSSPDDLCHLAVTQPYEFTLGC